MNPILELRDITKRFPSVVASNHINLAVNRGEIHALLGENGAGKTTLMNILYGLYAPDEGEILLDGKKVEIKSPLDAIGLGINMVHQHFMLVDTLTVAENVVLGLEPARFGWIDSRSAIFKVRDLSEKYGLKVDPVVRTEKLSVGEKQRVEILKALYRGANILILDEPTAVLTPQEVTQLFNVMGFLREQGKTVIFITHKLKETMIISDRVTVLQRGCIIGNVETPRTNPRQLARMMVGRDVVLDVVKKTGKKGSPVLELENLSARNAKGTERIKDVNLTISAGEILGIAGVEGNGQGALLDAIIGLTKPEKGTISINGTDITKKDVQDRMLAGLAQIPEDRQVQGLVLEYSVAENVILGSHKRAPLCLWTVLQNTAIEERCRQAIQQYGIYPPECAVKAGKLSGGNQQRVILARELGSEKLQILLASQPTRGLDVGGIEFVYEKLIELSQKGKAVLLISADLDELVTLSDRIAVIYEGEILDEREACAFTQEELGLLMGGAKLEADVV
ncbi:MAG: ABC transporter ATP-binding protein [Anaerolineales bacterium]|nr:ABC transporter ATP-binding protein [Anaerolineales bacterium]